MIADNILIGELLSDSLRKMLRQQTSRTDKERVAKRFGISWYTLRRLHDKHDPIAVTENSKPAVIDLLRVAIANRQTWAIDAQKVAEKDLEKAKEAIKEVNQYESLLKKVS